MARYLGLALEFQLARALIVDGSASDWANIAQSDALAITRTALNYFFAA
ncbi:MAG: DUF1622 domain-containing protein [Pyrinomonadaceae bacterium]|nr:DUF1622 domain-containing protein [Pyrinomonadaceae bacterium]